MVWRAPPAPKIWPRASRRRRGLGVLKCISTDTHFDVCRVRRVPTGVGRGRPFGRLGPKEPTTEPAPHHVSHHCTHESGPGRPPLLGALGRTGHPSGFDRRSAFPDEGDASVSSGTRSARRPALERPCARCRGSGPDRVAESIVVYQDSIDQGSAEALDGAWIVHLDRNRQAAVAAGREAFCFRVPAPATAPGRAHAKCRFCGAQGRCIEVLARISWAMVRKNRSCEGRLDPGAGAMGIGQPSLGAQRRPPPPAQRREKSQEVLLPGHPAWRVGSGESPQDPPRTVKASHDQRSLEGGRPPEVLDWLRNWSGTLEARQQRPDTFLCVGN